MNDLDPSEQEGLKPYLKQDAQWFQEQAESQSKQAELLKHIETELHNTTMVEATPPRASRLKWLLPLAAVVSLALWLGNNQTAQTIPNDSNVELMTAMKQWPKELEGQTHHKLEAEQQAIITDIKSLKSRWFSI